MEKKETEREREMEKEKVRMAGGNEVENILLSIVVFIILLAFSLTK